jgi:hypothetical protein
MSGGAVELNIFYRKGTYNILCAKFFKPAARRLSKKQ